MRSRAKPAGATSAFVQVRALIALRRAMVRTRRGRLGFLLLALVVPVSLVGAASAGQFLSDDTAFNFSLLAPSVFLAFAALSVLSPLTASGGQDLYPNEQLVAYPIRASTQFLSGLVVLPLNLAWLIQLLMVCAASFLLLPLSVASLGAVVLLAAYVLAVSAAGQLVTWLTIGLRRSRRGRVAVWAAFGVLALGTVLALRTVGSTWLLDHSPTTRVVLAVVAAGSGRPEKMVPALLVLVVLATVAAVSLGLGWRACAWALRRPGGETLFAESAPVRRRSAARASLRAVDRASVWRSPSLRRGIFVLGLLPGGVAAVFQIDWTSLVILPGLVSAGAGLLFGVNAFCLDGTGAVWLASLPHEPSLAIRAKTRVLIEVGLACVLMAVTMAALRAERPPTLAEGVAVLCAAVLALTSVTGSCLRLSTTRPHKAELRGPRDTPAPPGAMAAYSLRLAAGTTVLGLVLAGGAQLRVWWLPLALSVPPLLFALRRVAAAWRRWGHPSLRARVVMTVGHG